MSTATATLTPISRAEAIRRFQSATHVTVVARAFRGIDTPNQGDGTPVVGVRREVARVTSTGVYYYVGTSADGSRRIAGRYATTRFNDGGEPQWSEDADGNLTLITHTSRWERAEGADSDRYITREYLRITYKLEGAAA